MRGLAVETAAAPTTGAGPLRAYADDLAVVSRDLQASLGIFGKVFAEYARVSGLVLNLRKTVLIPLCDRLPAELSMLLECACPGWNAAHIRHWAEYLGFVLGPEAGDKSWQRALDKFENRSKLWSTLGLGLHHTTVAYNVYMASLLGFLLHLELLPARWPRTEAEIFRRLVPGPGGWILPKDMHHLSLMFGMPHSFGDMDVVSLAARFRVAHREAQASGGLHVRRRTSELNEAYRAAICMRRCASWGEWFRGSYYHRLQEALDNC